MSKGFKGTITKINRAFLHLENFVVHQRRSSQGYGTFRVLQVKVNSKKNRAYFAKKEGHKLVSEQVFLKTKRNEAWPPT